MGTVKILTLIPPRTSLLAFTPFLCPYMSQHVPTIPNDQTQRISWINAEVLRGEMSAIFYFY